MNGHDSGPIWRYGGKGLVAPKLIPHFARAQLWVEPFFGAGGVFFQLPDRVYQRYAVNDLDSSIITFFRVLRDRPDDLVRMCELTPYAREEFIACLPKSDDPLEEARRVWVRGRQGFAGKASSKGDWARPSSGKWYPSMATEKDLRAYAKSLRNVAVDCIDAQEFVAKWGGEGVFVYNDPPYAPEARKGESYEHELTADDHRALAAELHAAVGRGAKVAVSGYPSTLYSELFSGWRTVEFDVALNGTRDATGMRRTEVLWMSYQESDSIGGAKQRSLF